MHYDEGHEGELSRNTDVGEFVCNLDHELASGELLNFEVRSNPSGGLQATCNEYPSMVIYGLTIDELQESILVIAPGFGEGMQKRDNYEHDGSDEWWR